MAKPRVRRIKRMMRRMRRDRIMLCSWKLFLYLVSHAAFCAKCLGTILVGEPQLLKHRCQQWELYYGQDKFVTEPALTRLILSSSLRGRQNCSHLVVR